MRTATVTLESISPYSQSGFFASEPEPKESKAAFEARCWREKMHTDSDGYLVIPPMSLKYSVDEACKRLAVVDAEKLSAGQRRDYYANLSLHGAIQHVTSSKAQKAIASKVNGSTQQLAVAMTLKALAE